MKRKIAYRFHVTNCHQERDYTYAHAYIEVRLGSELDAAKEYDHEPDSYRLERLQQIRAEGKSTKYFSACDSEGFTIRFLTDRECWERDKGTLWYGCCISDAKIEQDTCKLLAKLSASVNGGFYTTPAQVLGFLRGLGARPVKYAKDTHGAWIYTEATAEDEAEILAANPFADTVLVA